MKILALDLGKNKSVFVSFVTGGGDREYGKVATTAQAIHDLLVKHSPDRLVIEAGPSAGWVHDLGQALGIQVQVANGNDERWRWKQVKNKTDRKDADKLGTMSEMDCLPTVHMPTAQVRQWRSLIEYRRNLVARRTAIRNNVRSIFERQGLRLAGGQAAWTKAGCKELEKEALEGSASSADQLWRFQLHCELEQMEGVQRQVGEVEKKLQELAANNEQVQRLQTAPQVGPRLSETVVAVLDDPQRFKNSRQVACYAGLTPRRWQSGESDRQGHISKTGNSLLRSLLVEIAWLGVRANSWMRQVYENVRRGSDKRKKIAIVAVARRLLVKLWAMMRDGTEWKDPVPASAALLT